MGWLYQYDQAIGFNKVQVLRSWLALAEYQCFGETFTEEL